MIFAADGSRLGYVQSDEIRTPIPWREMPEDLRDATVAIEDERFYKHKGVDYSAIVRAGVRNIESGETVQGGSTITQQLVRALYIKDPRAQLRAQDPRGQAGLGAGEASTRRRWILQNYLNSVPYGTVGGRTAIGSRGRRGDLLLQAREGPRRCPRRRCWPACPRRPRSTTRSATPRPRSSAATRCCARWPRTASSRPAEADEAAQAPLGVKHGTRYTTRREPYFFDYVQEQLIEKYGVGVYRRGGLKVHTTINPKLQEAARQAITGQLPLSRTTRRRRSSRSTRRTATSRRWPRAAPTRTARSTSPRRATASRARPSRRWC